MQNLLDIIDIQNKIYKLNNDYVMKDIDIANLFYMNIKDLRKIIRKNINYFKYDSVLIQGSNLLLKEDAIITLSFIIYSLSVEESSIKIINSYDLLNNRLQNSINKIKIA